LTHPWFDEVACALPGRAAHIALLVAAQGYVEDGPHGTKARAVAPLMSQPLVEHCLRVPSWAWFAQGRNRAAARRAFETLLPAEVARRRSKGSPNGLIARLFETKRAWIRDLRATLTRRVAKLHLIEGARPHPEDTMLRNMFEARKRVFVDRPGWGRAGPRRAL